MARRLRSDPLVELLDVISGLLDSGGEPRWARRLSELADSAAQQEPSTRRFVVTKVLALYGGMGSFNDIVLQDRRGVLPEQEELDRLRSQLFEVARSELS